MSRTKQSAQLPRDLQEKAKAALAESMQRTDIETAQEKEATTIKHILEQAATAQPPITNSAFQPPPSEPHVHTFRNIIAPHPPPNPFSQPANPVSGLPTPTHPPSLLQYVDTVLPRYLTHYNQPPDPSATCSICTYPWNYAPIATPYLPLGCGHWLHYRCLIWLACQLTPDNSSCPTCRTQLFEWDGITVLTVVTRTSLNLCDQTWPMQMQYIDYSVDNVSGMLISSDYSDYEAECLFIESLIVANFASFSSVPSKHPDGSPDIAGMYYAVLQQADQAGRPRCKWLRWRTYTGFLLFGMMVAVKVRRWVIQERKGVLGSSGWREFEEGWKALQGKILAEVANA